MTYSEAPTATKRFAPNAMPVRSPLTLPRTPRLRAVQLIPSVEVRITGRSSCTESACPPATKRPLPNATECRWIPRPKWRALHVCPSRVTSTAPLAPTATRRPLPDAMAESGLACGPGLSEVQLSSGPDNATLKRVVLTVAAGFGLLTRLLTTTE